MKTTLMTAAALVAGATAALAQQTPQTPGALDRPPAQAAAAGGPSLDTRRSDVRLLEGILAAAVRAGAEDLGRRMQLADPSSVIITGTARARGISLDGYGVFFDVDVPMMRQSVIWTQRQMMLQNLRDQISALQHIVEGSSDPNTIARANLQMRLLTSQLPLYSPDGALAARPDTSSLVPVTGGSGVAGRGLVSAATAADTVPSLPPLDARDPNELYTDAVKKALIDAMLNYSVALHLADEEWLTVAARDSSGPPAPGALDAAATIVLRIKGADLAAFHQNKLSRDDVAKKVQISEF